MKTEIVASVIIPTKNPGELFRKVLDMVRSQNTDFKFDVLIIDSGSTDGTIEYVEEIIRQDSRIELYQISPAEFGHGRTRNLAISMTTGKYAVLLTHDACPTSDRWLENLVRIADSDVKIAGVFGKHIAYPSANPFVKNELESHFATFENSPVVKLDDADRYKTDSRYRQYLHFFSDNNALIRRSVWEKIQYPDVEFAEDQIWAKKIIEAGWSKAYAQNAVVYHSHDYTLVERFKRSFDESYAYLLLFDYKLVSNLASVIKTWVRLTARDSYFFLRSKFWRRSFFFFLLMPFDNFLRALGYYLGAKGKSLSWRIRKKLSLDHKLFLKSQMSKK